jgi:ankyrin repeat protein
LSGAVPPRVRRERQWHAYEVDPAQPPLGSEGAAQTLMHAFAWNNEHRGLRRLARRGGDVNVVDDSGESPLHGAAAIGCTTSVRELIRLGARADIAAAGSQAYTPLHWAAKYGHLGVIRALVRAGAPLDARDAEGYTPQDVARIYKEPRAERWLEKARSFAAKTTP